MSIFSTNIISSNIITLEKTVESQKIQIEHLQNMVKSLFQQINRLNINKTSKRHTIKLTSTDQNSTYQYYSAYSNYFGSLSEYFAVYNGNVIKISFEYQQDNTFPFKWTFSIVPNAYNNWNFNNPFLNGHVLINSEQILGLGYGGYLEFPEGNEIVNGIFNVHDIYDQPTSTNYAFSLVSEMYFNLDNITCAFAMTAGLTLYPYLLNSNLNLDQTIWTLKQTTDKNDGIYMYTYFKFLWNNQTNNFDVYIAVISHNRWVSISLTQDGFYLYNNTSNKNTFQTSQITLICAAYIPPNTSYSTEDNNISLGDKSSYNFQFSVTNNSSPISVTCYGNELTQGFIDIDQLNIPPNWWQESVFSNFTDGRHYPSMSY